MPSSLRASSSKTRMNSAPIILRFCSGFGDARELVEEAVDGVDVGQVRAQLMAEYLYDLLALALAHEPVVDVYALELPADGLNEQRGDDGRVHAAGEGQQDLAGAYLRAQGLDLLGDKGLGELGRGNALHLGTYIRIVAHNSPP